MFQMGPIQVLQQQLLSQLSMEEGGTSDMMSLLNSIEDKC